MARWQADPDLESLPLEALAILEYAQRNGFFIDTQADSQAQSHKKRAYSDLYFTADELRLAVRVGEEREGFDPSEHLWLLVNPADVIAQLEQEYEIAKANLQKFRDRVAKMSVAGSEAE
jgi:hypothetical protein